ncbi:pyridoxal phosphate-dependent transferase [Lipomyces orientalis]|uniref:Pyridoxal phosphate-dependent transferase n=1 Tax=Lipomyces orientalis TaxID=1233043 RepID=A0ACC3TUZ2_9ASCO
MTVANLTSPAFDLKAITRPNILQLEPYRCARDDYKTGVLLDANENAYGPSVCTSTVALSSDVSSLVSSSLIAGLNRYPDPHQEDVKQLLCDLRNAPNKGKSDIIPLTPDNLYVGVGSDECVDTIIRCFAAPGRDKMLTCPPTYGMYSVSAQVNDVEVVTVNLDLETKGLPLRADKVMEALSRDSSIHLVYLCSPGNPTASLIDAESVEKILAHPTWNGIVVVDEAYIDFSPVGSSLAPLVTKFDNLIVMQTLSKAFGMAGIRFGVSYASPAVARILNNVKAPYNISSLTSTLALRALSPSGLSNMHKNIDAIVRQRARLLQELPKIPGIGNFIGGNASNFLLVQILDKPNGVPSSPTALRLYETLAESKGVVIRYRGKEPGCVGGLRITVGTEEENTILLEKIREALADIYSS